MIACYPREKMMKSEPNLLLMTMTTVALIGTRMPAIRLAPCGGNAVRRTVRWAARALLGLALTLGLAHAAPRFTVDAGHSVRVGDIRFSPDGRYMASLDYSGKIVVREWATGTPVQELRTNEAFAVWLGGAIDFSPDGRWFVVGSSDSDTYEGRVRFYGVGNFEPVFTVPVHGLNASEPGGLSDLHFARNGDLLTTSRQTESSKAITKAWRVEGHTLRPVSLESEESEESEEDELPDDITLTDTDGSCSRPDGSGAAANEEGLFVWDAGGPIRRVPLAQYTKDRKHPIWLWCMATGGGVWLMTGKHAGADEEMQLSDKNLYSWLPGDTALSLVHRLGRQSMNAVRAVPHSQQLLANFGQRLLRYAPRTQGPVAELPVSAGRIKNLQPSADGQGLLLDASYNYFVGGEYIPHTYPRTARLLDLSSGRQVDASGDAECKRFGALVEECEPFSGGYSYPVLKLRTLGGGPQPTLPAALEARGVKLGNVIAWSPDGQRLIAKYKQKVADREKNITVWYDRSTGRTAELTWPLPEWPETQQGMLIWPRLDIASVQLKADGEPVGFMDNSKSIQRILIYRLPDRQRLAEWSLPEGATDRIETTNADGTLMAVVRHEEARDRWTLFVRRLDGTPVLQRELPADFEKGVVAFEPDGSALVAMAPGDPGRAALLRWPLRGGAPAAPQQLNVLGIAESVAALGERGVAIGTSDGAIHLFDRKGKETATYFAFPDGQWLTMLPSGYFMASSQNVAARIYALDARGQRFRLDTLEERFYRPDIVQMALAGQSLPANLATVDAIKPAPLVAIVNPPSQVSGDRMELQLQLTDRGGGVGALRVFLNGSAVAQTEARDLEVVAAAGAQVRRVPVHLANGDNEISVIAFNADGSMASTPVKARVRSLQAASRKPALHALVVGINEFENPRLNLRYSVPDAVAVARLLEQRAKGLFGQVNIRLLTRKDDTARQPLLDALKAYRTAGPDDVFLFFIATHGTVEGQDLATKEYFLVPSNVGSVSERALRRDAISQTELKAAIANIPATKKVLILDTCHSGAFGEALAVHTRGMAEEGALKVLSRAVGSTVLSASTSQQAALEGHEGHGLFSFALLQGLSGKADARRNGFVNTGDLANYVEDEVPKLAERYQHKQYPTRFLEGQSFPLVMSK